MQNIALNTIVNARFLTELFLNKRAFLEKKPLYLKKKYRKTFFLWGKENAILTKKKISFPLKNLKKFLTKLTNCKIKLIFLNTLSLTKFFFLISESGEKKKARYNILQIQRLMLNRFKYHAIFIKDFIHLAFISILLKSTETLVTFIGEQFKRLPKNRKQLKLLTFLQQTLKILCGQRKEFLGFKFQIKGRLNRRNRTRKWTFQKGILALQTSRTRIEYGYSEGWTRSGLIGIHIWFFYKKSFKSRLKKKILKYLTYSQKKKDINNNIDLQQPYIYKKKIKAIPHIQKFNFYKKKYVKTQSKKI